MILDLITTPFVHSYLQQLQSLFLIFNNLMNNSFTGSYMYQAHPHQKQSSLTADRKAELQDALGTMSSKKCTKRELLSLIGRLAFACRVIPAGRTFMCRPQLNLHYITGSGWTDSDKLPLALSNSYPCQARWPSTCGTQSLPLPEEHFKRDLTPLKSQYGISSIPSDFWAEISGKVKFTTMSQESVFTTFKRVCQTQPVTILPLPCNQAITRDASANKTSLTFFALWNSSFTWILP